MSAIPDAGRWRGRRVFVTGHTGFVGGWLCAWLTQLGARVHGFSLEPPTKPSFFESTRLYTRLASSVVGDIRDRDALARAIAEADPQDAFHLAAQPIVREAHRDPVTTYATNLMGTVNVLEACRGRAALEGLVAFTTDKVYRNDGSGRAFEEGDPLGGNEPYSASKAACDWAIGAWWESYLRASPTSVAIVRAGNIVGGGDWGVDRLLPDAMRAFGTRKPLVLRHPRATRPWQHVLDAVRGALLLAEHGMGDAASAGDIAWNLGPSPDGECSVGELADLTARAWGDGAGWRHERDDSIPEAQRLRLSSAKAARELGWECAWDVERAVNESVAWHKVHAGGGDVMDATERQVAAHVADVERSECELP